MPERIYKCYIGEELVAEWKGAKTMDKTCNKCACNKVCNHDLFGFENCGNFISAADVVEVVRCKDCEYAKEYKNNLFCCYYPRAPKSVSSNDYCSYGIRKDDDEE